VAAEDENMQVQELKNNHCDKENKGKSMKKR
jgi:hypothetical protein